jgi:uncharacterized protein YggT (Ycf19 family)
MFYLVSVFIIWFAIRVSCRYVSVTRERMPYELNRILLEPVEPVGEPLRSWAVIQPVDSLSISEEEIRAVLQASKALSRFDGENTNTNITTTSRQDRTQPPG